MKTNIFNPNSLLSRTFSFLFDIFALSLCWFVCSIPILTLGASSTALFYSMSRYSIKEKKTPISDFFTSFKENIKISLILQGIIIVFILAIAYSMYLCYQMMQAENILAQILFFFEVFASFFLLGYLSYIYPTLALYKYNIKELLSVSFKLSLCHLPATLLFALLYVASAIALYYFWPLLIVIPALINILKAKILNTIYRKHTA